jgi:hypothetical protein
MIIPWYSNNRPFSWHKRNTFCGSWVVFVKLHVWNQGNGVNRKKKEILKLLCQYSHPGLDFNPGNKAGLLPKMSHCFLMLGKEQQGISCFDLLKCDNVYQLFGDAYCPHLQGRMNFVIEFFALLKIRRYVKSPEEGRCNLHRVGSLKSRMILWPDEG